MNHAALYDLAPVARLMLLGVVIALGPLVWVWLRNRQASVSRRLHVLTLVTLFLTFDLVLFGAFTRLTDSGLGCPDWPGCYGNASPMGARHEIAAAQAVMPTGPVTFSKAWIEMIHRYLATAVGVLILVLAAVSWMERRRIRISAAWPWMTLFWVCLQGAFGALTVTMKLFPAIVTMHLLGGLVLLALLRAQAVNYAVTDPDGMGPVWLPARERLALLGVFGLVWLQIALGGWVSTNYAVLACSDFPTCHGRWWPDMALSEGFTVWRHLGVNAMGEPISFAALVGIHYVHRLMAYGVLLALGVLAWRLWRIPGLHVTARSLLALLLWQFASGLSNVVLGWPLLAAVGHTAGAAGLVIVLTGALAATRAVDNRPVARSPDHLMSTAQSPVTTLRPSVWRQYHALTKPRVIQLIVFCALIGMVLAVPGLPSWPQVQVMALASLGIWLVAGAAAAFNCVIEQQIDAKMRRTAWRPTAKGELGNVQTLSFSALLCGVGSVILYAWVNPLTMWLTFATFVGYAVIYTVILKPLTPQNIVIGGASGAMPPVLGWAAMTGNVAPEALILFLIIFLWTPPHFWALALYRVEDYRKSGLPMLPVTHGSEFTRLQILLYTLVLFAACLMPFIMRMSGWFYLAVAVALSLGFCGHAWMLWRNYSDAFARKTFRFSLWHLSLLFAAMLIDHYLP